MLIQDYWSCLFCEYNKIIANKMFFIEVFENTIDAIQNKQLDALLTALEKEILEKSEGI